MVPFFGRSAALQESVGPQIAAEPLQMLSGLKLDGRIVPVGFPTFGSKLLTLTFSPGYPAGKANQAKWLPAQRYGTGIGLGRSQEDIKTQRASSMYSC
jgi:hypothetical protein